MHDIVSVISELVRHQIIAKVIGSDSQRMFFIESVIKSVYIMLHIAIITYIIFIEYLVITFVILVESVTDFKIT